MDTYVDRHQNTFTQYIATRPIIDLCLEAEQLTGTRVSKRWWKKESLDLERMWMAAW